MAILLGTFSQADELIQEVIEQLRFVFRRLDGPSHRRIMRSYGAFFRMLPGEKPEGEGEEV